MSYLLVAACEINNKVNGSFNGSASPSVSFDANFPQNSVGNSSIVFTFKLKYLNYETINLKIDNLLLSYSGTASCDSPTISQSTTATPSLTFANCVGDGIMTITLNPGSALSADGNSNQETISSEFEVDNSPPTVSIGSSSPASGDSATNFSWPITFSGSNTINLLASSVTINDSGAGPCDTPVITNSATSTPTVTINNCIGTGTFNIVIGADVSTDSSGNANVASSSSANVNVTNAIACPSGYIPVPGSVGYGTSDFCVMKYEAKLEYQSSVSLDGNATNSLNYDTDYETPLELAKYKATSTIGGRPWVNIKRGENGLATGQGAVDACRYLNTQEGVTSKYDLISNVEWQTIARNITAQQSGATNNWGPDSLGEVSLNHGHADSSPNQSCDAANEFIQTDCLDSGGEGKAEEKRTHNLSNSEVIWDFAGNVWEWNLDNNNSLVYTGSGLWDFWTDITDIVGPDGISDTYPVIQNLYGPLDLTPAMCTAPSVNNQCGLGFLYDGDTGTIVRGGRWTNGTNSGVFVAYFSRTTSFSDQETGFRCVYHP